MRGWQLQVGLDAGSRVPLSVQIVRAISADIRAGRLRRGELLPGSRKLATAIGVSRNTVAAAYAELAAEGWLSTDGTRGTVVSESLPEAQMGSSHRVREWTHAGFELGSPPPVESLIPRWGGRSTLRWDAGVPDVRLTPRRELARAYRRSLCHRDASALQYARYMEDVVSPLPTALAAMLRSTRGLDVGPENIVVTRGSQMALYLLARALVRPGDVVALEDPGYAGARDAFRIAGANVVNIPVDDDGINVEALARIVARRRIRAVFITPHHQFPTTVTLPIGRRLALLELARRARFAVIEDDFDHEFRYEGSPVLPVASADPGRVVLYIGTLSKIFAPGIRIGYLVAPVDVAEQVRLIRNAIEIHGDRVFEAAVAELLEEGDLQRHVHRARRTYRARRDTLAGLLDRHLGDLVEFRIPAGGLALWCRIDPAIDATAWAERACAQDLFFNQGSSYFATPKGQPFLRLGFARMNEAELEVAVRRLTKALPRPWLVRTK